MTNFPLPDNLPIPEADGACDHLPGMSMPALTLPSTAGGSVDLSVLAGRTVVYIYPMTGRPGVALPEGWNDIPGARGCTPQSCAFRDHYNELQHHQTAVYGLSTQDTTYQQEAAARLHLPYPLLSDADFAFAKALSLPTFTIGATSYIKRITLIIADGTIVKVFYPVFPPDKNAGEVLAWLAENA